MSVEQPRALHLISGRSFTGPAAAALLDLRSLLAAGCPAWLGSRSGGALEAGCSALRVPFLGGFRLGRGAARWLRLPADLRRLNAAVREYRLSVVHLHRSDELLLARLGRARRQPFVLVRTWHRDPALLPLPLLREATQACDAFCCVSREHEAVLRERTGRPCRYLHPAVDTALFEPLACSAVPEAPLRLGLLGRWKAEEDRGQRAFLSLLRELPAAWPWEGVLLGRGEGRSALEEALRSHPHRGRIRLEETAADYPRQVAGLDLGLVFATGSDGTSRPVLEMLSCGVPVLLAQRPGLSELGEDASCARVLPAGDLTLWRKALGDLCADRALLQAMKRAARARALAVHALSLRGQALAGLYAEAWAGRGRA